MALLSLVVALVTSAQLASGHCEFLPFLPKTIEYSNDDQTLSCASKRMANGKNLFNTSGNMNTENHALAALAKHYKKQD
jgi:hypothetical protein